MQQVVLGDGAGGDAFGRVVCEGAVFLEEAAVGGGLGHGGRMTPRFGERKMERRGRRRGKRKCRSFGGFWDCLDVERVGGFG